jgi:teichuronic acid biosynthesis glycosyltransferase TuaG
MKVSVIIPMYNSKDTIKSAIESVLNQTYKEPIEIIVVNDGSKDGCEKIVEKMIINNQTNRTIKLINKPNGGVSSARNRGIKEANGEYIAFLDSDDMWHPQKLELVFEALKDDSIKFIGHSYTLENNFDKKFNLEKLSKVSFTKLLLKNFAVTPSIIIKKEICEYFDETMTHTEDHELWLRIALKTDVHYLDLPLTTLGRPTMTRGGLSANRWAMRKGELQMYKNIIRYKKSLTLLYPFLVIFSLAKHLRHIIKDYFAKNQHR